MAKAISIPDNEAWRIFFDVYRNLPELWDENYTFYKSKQRRKKAYEKLLRIYKMICKGADHEALTKRLLNIKRSYRREARKKREIEKTGKQYFPSLWYYSVLKAFLDPDSSKYESLIEGDQETSVAVECCLKEFGEDETTENVAETYEDGTAETGEASPEHPSSPEDIMYEESRKRLRSYLDQVVKENAKMLNAGNVNKKPKPSDQNCSLTTQPPITILRKIMPARDQPQFILRQILPAKGQASQINVEEPAINFQGYQGNPFNQNSTLPTQPYVILKKVPSNKDHEQPFKADEEPVKDEASAFAESWAMSFRQLSPMQKIYAKKAIEDILVLGQLECLSLNTVDTVSATAKAPDP